MSTPPTWTPVRLRIVAILAEANAPLWPLDVARATGIPYSTVYDTLRRLYDLGWAVGVTEKKATGRPARVLYRLTAVGRKEAAELTKEN